MYRSLIILFIAVTLFSCKKKEDPNVIEDANIIGTWKRVAQGVVSGSDTTYTTVTENIQHRFSENNQYEEIKYDQSGYSSVAHYTFNLSSDTLRFFSMGQLSHRNKIKLYVKTLIIHIPPDQNTNVLKLEKQ